MTNPEQTPDISGPTDEEVKAVARAIEETKLDFNYSIQLLRFVRGVSTYILEMDGCAPTKHSSHADAFEVVRRRKRLAQARAAIRALDEVRRG